MFLSPEGNVRVASTGLRFACGIVRPMCKNKIRLRFLYVVGFVAWLVFITFAVNLSLSALVERILREQGACFLSLLGV